MESFIMEENSGKFPYRDMGLRIARARESLTDMSQSDMTNALDLKEPTYGNYERGSRKMPPHVLAKFCEKTGASADWIYLGKGPMTAGNNEEKDILWKSYQQADEAVQMAIRALLKRDKS